MVNNYKLEKAIEFCLKEMFLRVGEEYPNDEITNDPKWYTTRSWTREEENSFREWAINYLRKALKYSKKRASHEINMFLLQWGWTTKQSLHIEKIKK